MTKENRNTNNTGLGRAERLKSNKLIASLFDKGSFLVSGSLGFKYLIVPRNETEPMVQIGVSVSKSKFKRAVDRNQIKRRIRNAYRMNKQQIFNETNSSSEKLVCMILFLKKEIANYELIEKDLILGLSKIKSQLVK